jgi:hypothetical protein
MLRWNGKIEISDLEVLGGKLLRPILNSMPNMTEEERLTASVEASNLCSVVSVLSGRGIDTWGDLRDDMEALPPHEVGGLFGWFVLLRGVDMLRGQCPGLGVGSAAGKSEG